MGRALIAADLGEVEFYGVDIDIKIDPKEITDNVWNMIGTEYRCIMTKSKRWRVIGWFDKPTDVTLAKAKAKDEVKAEAAKAKVAAADAAKAKAVAAEAEAKAEADAKAAADKEAAEAAAAVEEVPAEEAAAEATEEPKAE